ncbi:hypothetical protein [Nitrobacter winogradskyi]|uniref:Uncharacterized protein n=1 Tax=Nitrobacter winogradskyi TaxID=913 RepID=A0ACC6AH58_NITWI|nr:hypothetical protein [Nitrobacter winogradskyi]MCP1999088.1 hypothetical protein [Nitrobacter winogradskyi]
METGALRYENQAINIHLIMDLKPGDTFSIKTRHELRYRSGIGHATLQAKTSTGVGLRARA